MPHEPSLVLISSYTNESRIGIRVCSFDPQDGSLAVLREFDTLPQASYLACDPGNRRIYAVSETAEEAGGRRTGYVAACELDPETARLRELNRMATQGAHPCYVSLDSSRRLLYVANYSGANAAVFALQADGSLGQLVQLLGHAGSGSLAARQQESHPHAILTGPGEKHLFVPDLGIDEIVIYGTGQPGGAWERLGTCRQRPGSGPRHLVFHPQLPVAYVAGELDSTVSTLAYDAEAGALAVVQTVSMLPEEGAPDNTAADIHVSRDGRYVYASNRGLDCIAVYRTAPETGTLSFVARVPTEGRTPRNFALSPDGGYLLAANQTTGDIAVFRLDADGVPQFTGNRCAVPEPACIRFYGA